MGDAADGIATRIAASADLAAFHGFDIEVLAPGATFTTDLNLDQIACFAMRRGLFVGLVDFEMSGIAISIEIKASVHFEVVSYKLEILSAGRFG